MQDCRGRSSLQGFCRAGRKRLLLGVALVLIGSSSAGCAPRYVSYTKQGDALVSKGDLEGARVKYEAAVKKNTKYAPAIFRLGRLTAKEGDWASAQKFFSAAITADPQLGDAYRWRGEGFLRDGNLEAATADLVKARELEAADLALIQGITAYLNRDAALAFESLGEAARNPKEALVAGKFLLKTALASGAFAEASDALSAAAEPPDKRAAAQLQRIKGEVRFLKGDLDDAGTALDAAEDPLSFGFWYRDASPSHLQMLSAKGVVVEYVHLGSPAARAGILSSDLIISFDRNPVASAEQLQKLIAKYDKQTHREDALFEVLRGGEFLAIRVKAGGFSTREILAEAAAGGLMPELQQARDDLMRFP